MRQVVVFTLAPGRLGCFIRVSAAIHNTRHALPKPAAHLLQGLLASLILCSVVQQGRDRLILIASVFQYQRANSQQVRDIRCQVTFASLLVVQLERVKQSLSEAFGQIGQGKISKS